VRATGTDDPQRTVGPGRTSKLRAYGTGVTVTFLDRDVEFEQWRDGHPHGYIVNHDRLPRATYVVLHRGDCVRLRPLRGSNWTSTYGKTWAETLDEIRSWARSAIGTVDMSRCSFCRPPALDQ
jgi:hypothetical protein